MVKTAVMAIVITAVARGLDSIKNVTGAMNKLKAIVSRVRIELSTLAGIGASDLLRRSIVNAAEFDGYLTYEKTGDDPRRKGDKIRLSDIPFLNPQFGNQLFKK